MRNIQMKSPLKFQISFPSYYGNNVDFNKSNFRRCSVKYLFLFVRKPQNSFFVRRSEIVENVLNFILFHSLHLFVYSFAYILIDFYQWYQS